MTAILSMVSAFIPHVVFGKIYGSAYYEETKQNVLSGKKDISRVGLLMILDAIRTSPFGDAAVRKIMQEQY